MTKKGGFVWIEPAERAFEQLKLVVTTTLVLALLNFDELFEVHTDASEIGIGAVLVQGGHPLPI